MKNKAKEKQIKYELIIQVPARYCLEPVADRLRFALEAPWLKADQIKLSGLYLLGVRDDI